MVKKSQTNASLGRHLIKQKQKDLSKHLIKSQRHVLDLDNSQNVKSITETTTLDDFLSTAVLADKQFLSEQQQNVKIVSPNTATEVIATTSKDNSDDGSSDLLMIPRRPKWDESTTAEELNQMEYNIYLEWRRRLAQIQEDREVIVTPFEKNIEFWRQLWRVVERSDVCIQILDARNPLLFLCPDLQNYVKEVDENKMNIILLNKSDFLTEDQRSVWAQYFDSIGVKTLFFSAKQQLETDEELEESENIREIIESQTNSSKLLSREDLITIFKSFRSDSKESPITIGLVGYPNVGKSSTINAILQSKRVSVSATPGKTKHFQTLVVDSELTLCDCPGLVFPKVVSSKAEMIVNGILPIDHMKDAISPISLLTDRIPSYVFEDIYSIVLSKPSEMAKENHFTIAEELLTSYGYSRGFMTQRGIPDICRSARYILKDFVCGKLLYCFCPPNTDQNSFQKFPESNDHSNHEMSAKLQRILENNQTISKNPKDFDNSFFTNKSSGVHSKGVFGVSGYMRRASDSVRHCGDSQTSLDSKPWKRHNNRNKKEKLRRIYAHLDE